MKNRQEAVKKVFIARNFSVKSCKSLQDRSEFRTISNRRHPVATNILLSAVDIKMTKYNDDQSPNSITPT